MMSLSWMQHAGGKFSLRRIIIRIRNVSHSECSQVLLSRKLGSRGALESRVREGDLML